MMELDLQRFAEGMDGGAGEAGGGADTGAAQETAAGMQAAAGATAQQAQPTFDDLIAGQYRQEYEQHVGQRIQSAIQDRFKNQQNYRQQAEAARPIMAALGQKFGLNPDDVAGITAKLNEDAYAEEANKRGVPVDVVRNEHQLRDRVAQVEAREAALQQDMMFRQHYGELQKQAAEFAREFPGFDLMAEIQSNPNFAKWTSPQFGMSVREAYYASHGPQMQAQGMQYAARQAASNIAASVAAGASRPQENGMGRQNPAPMVFDPSNMSREQRQAIRQQLAMGKTVPI